MSVHITGNVKNAVTGQLLAGVKVTLRVRERENVAYTNDQGAFEWREDSVGVGEKLSCHASKSDYVDWEVTQPVTRDQLHLEIAMQPRETAPPVPEPEPVPAPVPPPHPGTWFDVVESDRGYPVAMARRPSVFLPATKRLFWIVVLVVIIGVSWALLNDRHTPFLLKALAFLAFPIGMIAFVVSCVEAFRFIIPPLHADAGLIIDKRFRDRGRHSPRVAYYVTIENSRGSRRELRSEERLYGQLGREDTGVAYVKGRYLIEFARLPAPK